MRPMSAIDDHCSLYLINSKSIIPCFACNKTARHRRMQAIYAVYDIIQMYGYDSVCSVQTMFILAAQVHALDTVATLVWHGIVL